MVMSNELARSLGSGTMSLSPRAERELARQVSGTQASGLARAYRVQMETKLAEHKVAALSSVACSAMSEVAFVHTMEDGLLKGLAGTPVAGVAADRVDLVSREFSIAAGQIMLHAARQIADL